jgi:hypothetical protein
VATIGNQALARRERRARAASGAPGEVIAKDEPTDHPAAPVDRGESHVPHH